LCEFFSAAAAIAATVCNQQFQARGIVRCRLCVVVLLQPLAWWLSYAHKVTQSHTKSLHNVSACSSIHPARDCNRHECTPIILYVALKQRKPERELPARSSDTRFVGIYVIQSDFLPQRKKEHEFEKARGSAKVCMCRACAHIKDRHLEYSRQFDRVYFEILFAANHILSTTTLQHLITQKIRKSQPSHVAGRGKNERRKKSRSRHNFNITTVFFEGAALQGVDLVVRD